MAGVWFWLRRDWRARWRSSAAIAALVAITGATVLALLAGARRTDASLERFDRVSLDAAFIDASETDPGPLRALADHPQVEAMGELAYVAAFPEKGDSYFPLLASVDGAAGRDLFRGVLLAGRHPDPDEPLEVALAEDTAARLGGVGTRLPFRSMTPEQWAVAKETDGEFPDTFAGPDVELRVVGVVRTGIDLSQRSEDPNPAVLTPAFFETYGERMGGTRGLFLLRLTGGFDAAPRFGSLLESAYRGKDLPIFEPGDIIEGVRGSNRVVSTGLVLTAAVAFVAGLGWLILALHRHVTGAAADLGVLGALGLGRRAQLALLLGTTIPGLAAGVVASVVGAVVVSPLLPVGLARRADPDVGLHADLGVLAPGVVAMAILGAGFAALGAVRARRAVFAERPPAPAGGPSLGERAGVRLGPVATTGLAFALSPGRNARATPVRPALVGAVAGLAGVVAVGVVGASMGRLLDTPARYGAPWDVEVSAKDYDRAAIVANSDIDAAAVGLFQRPVTVKGSAVSAYGLDPVKGGLGPVMARGRAPAAPDEVALGADTMGTAQVTVGGTVAIATAEKAAVEFRVVGQAVFPSPDDPFPVADGALLTPAGLDRLDLLTGRSAEEYGFRRLLIRWRPGVDHKAALARLGDIAEEPGFPEPGAEVARLAEVQRFPQVLAGFLVAVSLTAVAHGLAATVRRRRNDLAVLGALGFTPGQRRGVVAWQAAVLAAVGVALGLPFGIVAGRWAWAAMAGDLGVATDAAVPAAVLAAAAAGAAVAFGLLAAWSGRAAARLRPAEILRTE
ncbi:MAG TPA: FtsX-like permease family protein [Acidimicrobiales bacterium]|nr:FtsX-like permease family protein [Acidimicrobiales bacterium]